MNLLYVSPSPFWRDASVIFAMGQGLFNFFVNGHFFENRVVFLKLVTTRSVFAVFGSDVTRHTGHTA